MRKIFKLLIYTSINFLFLYLYKITLGYPLRIIEATLLVFIGSITSFLLCSFFINPYQFFVAISERAVRPFALIYIVLTRILSLFLSLFSRSIKLIIAIIITLLYGVSPIDLIPDFFLGVGWLDDIGVGLLSFYLGLTFTRIAMAAALRQHANEINSLTKIITNFP